MAWAVMAKAGLRPGEAYALRPGDLDLKAGTVRVERTLDLDGSTKPTKTYERRTVRLSSSLVESLRRHLLWLREQTLKQGWGTAEWLFPTAGNTPLDQSRATKAFHRAVAGLGHIPGTRISSRRPIAGMATSSRRSTGRLGETRRDRTCRPRSAFRTPASTS